MVVADTGLWSHHERNEKEDISAMLVQDDSGEEDEECDYIVEKESVYIERDLIGLAANWEDSGVRAPGEAVDPALEKPKLSSVCVVPSDGDARYISKATLVHEFREVYLAAKGGLT